MSATVYPQIKDLVAYGVRTGLISTEDEIFATNQLLELFQLEEPDEYDAAGNEDIEVILGHMLDYAAQHQLLTEDSITYRDLFDTKIMSILVPRPSEVKIGRAHV